MSELPTDEEKPPAPSLMSILRRAARCRCPSCGKGRIFQNWFRLYPRCEQCGYHFDRGAGYWLGSIYINYVFTAVIVTAGYLTLFFTEALPPDTILWLAAAFSVLFPLWCLPYARSLWLALDLYFDPQQTGEGSASYPSREEERKSTKAD